MKLSELCRINIGKTPKTNEYKYWNSDSKLYNWLTINDLTKNRIITKKQISEDAIKECHLMSTTDKSILFCFIGTIDIKKITSGYYYNQAIANLTIINQKIKYDYLFYYLKMNIENYKKKYNNSIYSYLNKKDIKNILVPVPDLDIQTKIIDQIKKITIEKNKFNNLLTKLNNVKNVILQNFFTSINSKSNEIELRKIIKTYTGKLITKDYLKKNTGIYPVYSSSVKNYGLMGSINTFMFDGEYGTYTTRGYAANLFYRNEKFNISTNAFAWNIKDKSIADFKYVYYYLKWKDADIKSLIINGSVVNMFSPKILLDYKISLPTIDIQNNIKNIDIIYRRIYSLEIKLKRIIENYNVLYSKIIFYIFKNNN